MLPGRALYQGDSHLHVLLSLVLALFQHREADTDKETDIGNCRVNVQQVKIHTAFTLKPLWQCKSLCSTGSHGLDQRNSNCHQNSRKSPHSCRNRQPVTRRAKTELMVGDRWNLPKFRQNFVFSNSGEPVQIVAPVSCSHLTGVVLCCCGTSFSFLGYNQSLCELLLLVCCWEPVCPFSFDLLHQQAIFIHTTAAHQMFSLFWTTVCKGL